MRNENKKALKNNGYRLYFEISVHLSKITDHCVFCPFLQFSPTGCRGQFSLLPNDFTRFSKVLTRNIFTFFQPQPELVLKLFLIFGQSEPLFL